VYENDNDTPRGEIRFAHILVKNVPPRFVDNGITVTKKGGSMVIVEGDFTDPGADTFDVSAAWSDL
jgi:hypothetical protein